MSAFVTMPLPSVPCALSYRPPNLYFSSPGPQTRLRYPVSFKVPAKQINAFPKYDPTTFINIPKHTNAACISFNTSRKCCLIESGGTMIHLAPCDKLKGSSHFPLR